MIPDSLRVTMTRQQEYQHIVRHAYAQTVRTTGVAGGLHWPYKGQLPAYTLRCLNDSPTAHNLLAAPSRGRLNYLPFPTGSPVNGSLNSFRLI